MDKLKYYFIVVVDIVGYTSKSSLLPTNELEALISFFDDKVNQYINEYKGRLIKGVGDGYIMFFDDGENAVYYLSALLNSLYLYNLEQKNLLKQIHLHSSIVYGGLIEKKTSLGLDYFGTALNLSYRINDIVLANHIYVDEDTKNLKLLFCDLII